MGEIESSNDAVLPRCGHDFFDVEQLTREKVHATKHHYRQLVGVLLDEIENVFGCDCEFIFSRLRENQRLAILADWKVELFAEIALRVLGIELLRETFVG